MLWHLILSLALAVWQVHAQNDPCTSSCQQSALAFAYQYGFPLYSYGLFFTGYNYTINEPAVAGGLATAQNRTIVRPNVDTLYTVLFYDLSQVDLELNIPEIEGRYWDWPFYDLYGNNFCNVGSLEKNDFGKYLLTYSRNGNFGLQTTQANSSYEAYINSPTPYGVLLVRIEALNPTSDIEKIHEINRNITSTPLNRTTSSGVPPFDTSIFSDTLNSNESMAEKILDLTAAHAPYNQPEVLSDRAWVNTTLTNAGIGNASFTQPEGTNLTAAAESAYMSAEGLALQAGFSQNLGNNWTQHAPEISGDYGSYYNARQLIAIEAYLLLTPNQAIYPEYMGGTLNVGPDEAYLFTYQAKPDLKDTGFWSLTAYGADEFLIANNFNRYAIGNRKNITYPDGTLVYGSNNATTSGGPFQVLLQPANVAPPANWTSNWLPAASGGGNFSVNFRVYGPQESMTNGSWEYPIVEKIAAIIA